MKGTARQLHEEAVREVEDYKKSVSAARSACLEVAPPFDKEPIDQREFIDQVAQLSGEIRIFAHIAMGELLSEKALEEVHPYHLRKTKKLSR